MQNKDTMDVLNSLTAVVCDALAVVGGFMAAVWIRFDSGWIQVYKGRPDVLYMPYLAGAGLAALLFLFIFQALGLYVRPQVGSFVNRIPRLVKGVGLGVLLSAVLAFAVQNEFDFARLVIGLSFFSIAVLVLLERYALYRVEWNLARHSRAKNKVLILGAGPVAAHVQRTIKREPMLRSVVCGFLRDDGEEVDPTIPGSEILGRIDRLESFVAAHPVDQIIVAATDLGQDRILKILLLCEQNLIAFNMVPDLFRVMTASMDVQSLDDIPLLGVRRWPLDCFWNRVLKRVEDVAGAAFGLVVGGPLIGAAALAVKCTSAGPAFYRQERCGEDGRPFTLYKLRTMREDAETDSGPVFAVENDERTTRVGAFLRRHNLDELPQLWNVLKGDMSLVGPRPERPHFVNRFKQDVRQYMRRHVSKPGMTGWAQVNGLRGNTSIPQRIKYDLYYLENWSPAFDLKILVRTLMARENAY